MQNTTSGLLLLELVVDEVGQPEGQQVSRVDGHQRFFVERPVRITDVAVHADGGEDQAQVRAVRMLGQDRPNASGSGWWRRSRRSRRFL